MHLGALVYEEKEVRFSISSFSNPHLCLERRILSSVSRRLHDLLVVAWLPKDESLFFSLLVGNLSTDCR
jgi:hypothetical protein